MSAPVPTLLFPPREMTQEEGRLDLPTPRHLPGTLAEVTAWLEGGAPGGWSVRLNPRVGAGSHQLVISPGGIDITAGDATGLLYALQTLRRLWAANPATLPCLTLTDGPALPVRGFMLD
ncbi:MAG: glycoside hydrolase family 20 zincin-like fold domain-containing protein, partial [Opitutia bacterium]